MLRLTIICMVCCLQLRAQIPVEGLQVFYAFNGNLQDSTMQFEDASSEGFFFTENRFGNASSAIGLNDAEDFLQWNLPGIFPLTGDFTISLWFKTAYQDRMHLLSNGSWMGGDDGNMQWSLASGSPLMAYWNGQGNNAMLLGEIPLWQNNKWHHAVWCRENDSLKWYVDGREIAQLSYSTFSFPDPIGVNGLLAAGDDGFPFFGAIDDLLIYDRALNATEMDSIYFDGRSIELISPASTDRYPVNSNVEVIWRVREGVDSLNAYIRSADSNTWFVLFEGMSANNSSFVFSIPGGVGDTWEVKLVNAANESEEVSSGVFAVSEYQWQVVNENNTWSPRDGAGLLNFNGYMWLIGGWNPYDLDWLPGYTTNEVWRSNDGTNWEWMGNAPWDSRHTAGWLVHDNKIWVIGGDWNSGVKQMDVWHSSDGLQWIEATDSMQIPARMTHLVASLNDELLLFGGQELTFGNFVGGEVYNDVWGSNDGSEWSLVTADAGWLPRGQIEGHFVRNDTLWLVGGGTYDARRMYSDVWFTTDGAYWEQRIAAASFPPRQYHEVAVFDNRIWVLGGYDGNGNRRDVWYSDDGISWFELKNTPWPARHAGAVCEFDQSLWMVSGNLWNDSWRLNRAEVPAQLTEDFQITEIPLWWNTSTNSIQFNSGLGGDYALHDGSGRLILSGRLSPHSNSLHVGLLKAGLYIFNAGGTSFRFVVL